jgi:hypothetical protein
LVLTTSSWKVSIGWRQPYSRVPRVSDREERYVSPDWTKMRPERTLGVWLVVLRVWDRLDTTQQV